MQILPDSDNSSSDPCIVSDTDSDDGDHSGDVDSDDGEPNSPSELSEFEEEPSELEEEPAIEKPPSVTDTESEEEDDIVGKRYVGYGAGIKCLKFAVFIAKD